MNPLIVISDKDNVATALEALEVGRVLAGNGTSITVRDAIPRGHKIAIASIPAGGAVVKYGSSIGIATAEIAPGSHVHTHNLSSARGRGDLAVPRVQPAPDGRLAEPTDSEGTPQ